MHARCLCGDVVWEAQEPLAFVHHCHCGRCRKTHGVAYATYGAVDAERFRFAQGESGIARFESSPGFFRCFCARCGSVVPGAPQDGQVFVPLGPLEGHFQAKVVAHIFAASKAPWFEFTDGLPRFDAFPPAWDAPPVLDDLDRSAEAARGDRIRGSCLCGAITFEIEGTPLVMRHCHCLRCRRARATPHASNAFVAPEQLHWTRGEEKVTSFKLPEAARFTQAFCPICGSPVPWLVRERGRYNVPLGALDDDPGGRPSEHIFVGSKARWHEIVDGLPQHEEYGAT